MQERQHKRWLSLHQVLLFLRTSCLRRSLRAVAPEKLEPLAKQITSFDPKETAADYKTELDVFNKMSRVVSFSSVAETVGRDEKTVRKIFRLTAAIVVLSKRYRKLMAAQRVHHHLREVSGGDFAALQFLLKDKFDELALRVRQLEDVRAQAGVKGRRIVSGSKKTVISKLVMLTSSTHCLWRVKNEYVSLRARDSTTICPIEAATGEGMLAARQRQLSDLSWYLETFELCGRISVADEHPSNGVSDWRLYALHPDLHLLQFICKFHKAYKAAGVLLRPFSMERVGLVHSTLSFQFGGTWTKFEMIAKKLVEDTLVNRSWGVSGAGPAAARYREQVEALFCHMDETRMSPKTIADLRARQLVKREFLNGDFQNENIIDHRCPYEGHCPDRAFTVRSINEGYIGRFEAPKVYNVKKWLGPQHSFDTHGELLCTHNIMGRTYKIAFGPKSKSAADPGSVPGLVAEDEAEGGDAEEHAEVPVLYARAILDGCADDVGAVDAHAADAAAEAGLTDPTTGSTAFERQTTYRGNALQWYDSLPRSRYVALRQIHTIQQDAVAHLMGQVGFSWGEGEAIRRARGERPRYRGAMLESGEYTDKALQAYGAVVREEHRWLAVTGASRTQALACACYRSSASAAACTEQLQKARERTYPYKPFGLLNAKDYAERKVKATDLDADRMKFLCFVSPFWLK